LRDTGWLPSILRSPDAVRAKPIKKPMAKKAANKKQAKSKEAAA
jgi:hypothetical protein